MEVLNTFAHVFTDEHCFTAECSERSIVEEVELEVIEIIVCVDSVFEEDDAIAITQSLDQEHPMISTAGADGAVDRSGLERVIEEFGVDLPMEGGQRRTFVDNPRRSAISARIPFEHVAKRDRWHFRALFGSRLQCHYMSGHPRLAYHIFDGYRSCISRESEVADHLVVEVDAHGVGLFEIGHHLHGELVGYDRQVQRRRSVAATPGSKVPVVSTIWHRIVDAVRLVQCLSVLGHQRRREEEKGNDKELVHGMSCLGVSEIWSKNSIFIGFCQPMCGFQRLWKTLTFDAKSGINKGKIIVTLYHNKTPQKPMRILLVFALVALPSWAAAQQQVIVKPANSSDACVIETSVVLGGEYIASGWVSSQALVLRHDALGNLAWSKVCESNTASAIWASAIGRGGKIVVAGEIGDDSFVASFNQDGTSVWAKKFSTDSTERWNSLSTDLHGDTYLAGHKRTNSANSVEIMMKLDAWGNIVWSRQGVHATNSYSSAKYCFYRGSDSLVVIGQTRLSTPLGGLSNGVLTATVLSATTGDVIDHQLIGTFSHETLLDAEANENGVFLLFFTSNASNRIVMKLGWPALNVVANPKILMPDVMSGYSLDIGGELTLDGADIYVSGGANGNSSQSSYVVKLDQSLSVQWAERVTSGTSGYQSFGSAGIGIGGGIALFDAKNGSAPVTQSIMTPIASSGGVIGAHCESLIPLVVDTIPYPVSSEALTLAVGLLNFTVTDVAFTDYLPTVTPCFQTTLPAELLSFDGEKQGNSSVLTWRTGSEHGTSHFQLRRSIDVSDENSWEVIGSVSAVGESMTERYYSYVDEEPIAGTNYYQLETIDLDGSVKYSEVVAVNHSFNSSLDLYPNPVLSGEAIYGTGGEAFQVTNIAGQVILQSSGLDTTLPLPAGMYVLKTTTGATARVVVK